MNGACRSLMFRSNIRFGGNRETPPIAKSFGRNLDPRSRLLAFVLIPLDHADDASYQLDIEAVIARNLLDRVRLLHIILENSIQHVVRRQAVAVHLAGPKLGG